MEEEDVVDANATAAFDNECEEKYYCYSLTLNCVIVLAPLITLSIAAIRDGVSLGRRDGPYVEADPRCELDGPDPWSKAFTEAHGAGRSPPLACLCRW